jgi:NTP pyrophosphatase (non-canonical NTP hydrolase)
MQNYQALALRTEKPLPTRDARLHHAALGIDTETGEIATEIKRIAIYGKAFDDVNKDGKTIRAHVAEEIGDTFWYVAIAAAATDTDFFADVLPTLQPYEDLANVDLDHIAFALASASGRFAEAVVEGHSEMAAECLKRLGNILLDLSALIGIPLNVILADNIAKLQARYPDAYSNEAAEARADKGGLDARNS